MLLLQGKSVIWYDLLLRIRVHNLMPLLLRTSAPCRNRGWRPSRSFIVTSGKAERRTSIACSRHCSIYWMKRMLLGLAVSRVKE